MIYNLTLVHLLLALGAGSCVYFALREIRRRYVSIWRLFVPAALATAVAGGMFLLQVIAHQPPWAFEAAVVAGLAIGMLRGFTTVLRIDLYMSMLQERSAAKRALLWVPIVLAVAVATEIVSTIFTPVLENLQFGAALVATCCAGMLVGRALVLSIRLAASLMSPAPSSQKQSTTRQAPSEQI